MAAPYLHLRRAFTLVELLVVIVIIAILIALLLPAIQSARESARRSVCNSNMKQVGLALYGYHDANRAFPYSVYIPNTTTNFGAASGPAGYRSWIVLVLPWLEGSTLRDSLKLNSTNKMVNGIPPGTNFMSFNSVTGKPWNGSSLQEQMAGQPPRGSAVDVQALLCPSDFRTDVKFQYYIGSNQFNQQPDQVQLYARNNYAVNACATNSVAYPGGATVNEPPCGWRDQAYWTGPYSFMSRGVMAASVSLSLKQITDGSSHTLLAGEVCAGLNYGDGRGVWSFGAPGANALWRHTQQQSPNSLAVDWLGKPFSDAAKATGIPNDGTHAAEIADLFVKDGIPAGTADPSVGMQTGSVRSRHPGGAHVLFADGSAHFISDFIEHGNLGGYWELEYDNNRPNFMANFLTWERLVASGDGLLIDETKIE